MKLLLRRRPTPSMAVALLALFVALGGTSYAAITITGKNVKNGSLTGADVKNSSLTGSDVKNNKLTGRDVTSVTGSDIKNGSIRSSDVGTETLNGSDIVESQLGKVPSAAQADSAGNANTLGGKSGAQLKPAMGFGQSGTIIPLTGAGQDVVSTTITLSAPGRIAVNGSVELSGATADERAGCAVAIDGTGASLGYETTFDDIGEGNEASLSVQGSRADVPAGTHTVAIRCNELTPGAVTKDDAAVTAISVPN